MKIIFLTGLGDITKNEFNNELEYNYYFEINSIFIEQLKLWSIELNFSIFEEYVFENDNKHQILNLLPKVKIRSSKEIDLSKVFF